MKKVVLIISSIIVLVAVTGVFFYTNQTKKPKIDSIIGNYYYVEKGQEKFAKLIKPAVENYLTQDRDETVAARNKRLGKYFSADSPVYGRALENLNPSINKTSAIVTSIMFKSLGGEGMDEFFVVIARVTYSSGDKSATNDQTYWISTTNTKDSGLMAFDIGDYQL